jgi:hypothetical protein
MNEHRQSPPRPDGPGNGAGDERWGDPGGVPRDPGGAPRNPGSGPQDPGPGPERFGPDREPPRGWEDFDPGRRYAMPPRPAMPDFGAILALLDALRGMVPRELESQMNALIREVLLTIRALIDWYLERLDSGPREPRVEDIPID